MTVKDHLVPLKEQNSNEDYIMLWRKLFDSARDLDSFFEESKKATFDLKKLYDDIKKKEQLNDGLRFVYYDALSKKTKHQEDRDNYFRCDKELAEMKDQLVENSQQFAFSCTRYIEYSQRFSSTREELFAQFLKQFGRVVDEKAILLREKKRLSEELHEHRKELGKVQKKAASLENRCASLSERKEELERNRDKQQKEVEWMQMQNKKLQERSNRLEKELAKEKAETKKLTTTKREDQSKLNALLEQNNNLLLRCARLDQLVTATRSELEAQKSAAQSRETALESEKEELQREIEVTREKLAITRENNHRTIVKNQQLRERLSETSHRVEKATNAKLRSTAKEYKTQKVNTELATKQLGLIDEVLELKKDFFQDQARIRKGAELNRKLEMKNRHLEIQVRKMRENPSAIDPLLDGADEYRRQLLQRFGANKSLS